MEIAVRLMRSLFAAVCFVATGVAGPAIARDVGLPKVDFQSRMVVKDTKGREFSFRLYYTKPRMRADISVPDPSTGQKRELVMILDRAAKKIVMLFPANKVYLERPFDPEQDIMRRTLPGKRKMQAVGTETIAGHKTTKFKVAGETREKHAFSGFAWVTKDDIVMKVDGKVKTSTEENSFAMEMKDLKIGKIDPKRFAIPDGYSKAGGKPK
jgi:hypothetical protein